MDSCVVGGPANDYFLNWYCERSAIIAQQMNIWQTWVLPVYHAMNLVYKAGRAEVLRNMVFDSESWDCSELFGTDAQLFGASQDRNHPQLLADCPFEIKTTYQYTKGYVDKGTGARFELGLWHPAGASFLKLNDHDLLNIRRKLEKQQITQRFWSGIVVENYANLM